jgi:hypothetical protein
MSAVPNETKTTSLSALRRPEAPEASLPQVRMGFENLQGFELMQRASRALASSTLVPQQFQNNMPNCLIALEMAQRIGASPLMVMQNLYIVHGRPGWSSKFLIASFNQCGRFSAVRFQWFGTKGKDDWGCRAYATEKATGEKIEGPLITIALAKEEGWVNKSGSKWKTIPELMLMYRAAGWMINTHAPEISMGLNTAEELGDVYDAGRTADGTFAVTTGELQQGVSGSVGGEASARAAADANTETVVITKAYIAAQVAAATTVDDIALAEDLIGSIDSATEQDELRDAAAKKRAEIERQ